MSQTSCRRAEMLRARQQRGQHATVTVGWADARKLGLHFLG